MSIGTPKGPLGALAFHPHVEPWHDSHDVLAVGGLQRCTHGRLADDLVGGRVAGARVRVHRSVGERNNPPGRVMPQANALAEEDWRSMQPQEVLFLALGFEQKRFHLLCCHPAAVPALQTRPEWLSICCYWNAYGLRTATRAAPHTSVLAASSIFFCECRIGGQTYSRGHHPRCSFITGALLHDSTGILKLHECARL